MAFVVVPLDEPLQKEVDIIVDSTLFDNEDAVIIIDGLEGTGKSKLARQIGAYIAQRANLDFTRFNIKWDLDDYIRTGHYMFKYGRKCAPIILDEGRNVLNTRKAMHGNVIKFTNWLSENRKLNLIHIICVPASHDLDKYVKTWRNRLLIHVKKYYVKDTERVGGYKTVRGQATLHSVEDMAPHYENPQRYGYYTYSRPLFKISFTDQDPFDEETLKSFYDDNILALEKKYEITDEMCGIMHIVERAGGDYQTYYDRLHMDDKKTKKART